MEKKEIVSHLYNLRAGLSVIVMEKDKVDGYRKQITLKEKDIEEKIESIEKLEEERVWVNNQLRYSVFKNIIHIFYKFLLYSAVLALCIIACIKFTKFVIKISVDDDYWNKIVAWVHIDEDFFAPLLLLILIAVAIILVSLTISVLKKWYENSIRRVKWIPGSISSKKKAKKRLPMINSEIDLYQFTIPKNKKEIDKISQFIIQSAKHANNVFKILEQKYSHFLDMRDWKYIDLLLFNFETGRTDSLKEALHHVDKQVRTDTIVQAINESSLQIRRTILQSTEALGKIMVGGITLISSQMNSMQDGIRTQNSQLSQLVSQQNMQLALQKKANISSLKLSETAEAIRSMAGDIKQIRLYNDSAEIRRNNIQ